MSYTKILLITGKAQSGKDTLGEFLQEHLANKNLTSGRFSFAKTLKDFCVNVLNVPKNCVWGSNEDKDTLTHLRWRDLPINKNNVAKLRMNMNAKDRTYMTGREVLQIWGTEICRKFYSDCWVHATLSEINRSASEFKIQTGHNLDYAIITDCRFPNEVKGCHLSEEQAQLFPKIWTRPQIIRLLRNPLDKKHESETALDTFDFSPTDCLTILNENMTQEEKNQKVLQELNW